jgi:hypothetical protein
MSQRERIKVVCRIRPENKLEKEGSYQKCVTFEDQSIAVTVRRSRAFEKINILYYCSVHQRAK